MRTDLHYAIRNFLKRPGFSAIVVITLALGMGANTAIFTIANAFLIRPLPFRESSRLVAISDLQPPHSPTPASYLEFEDWQRTSGQIFSGLAAQFPSLRNLTNFDEPRRIPTMQVARGYFGVF